LLGSRKQKVELLGLQVDISSPEDTILMKLGSYGVCEVCPTLAVRKQAAQIVEQFC